MKRLLFIFMIVGSLFAQEVKLDLKINGEVFHIGDRIKIRYTIEAGERYFFVLPDVREWFNDAEILNVGSDKKIKKQTQVVDLFIEAVAFDTGFVQIPQMPIITTDSTGFGKPDTLFTPEKYIYIQSVLDSASAPLAMDAPLPLAIMTWWEFLVAILLFMLSAGLLIFGIKYHKNKRVDEAEIWESPIEKAEHYLDQLEKKHYPEKAQWKKFYLELTYIARDYFENIFFIHLQELTTTDLIPVLEKHIEDNKIDTLKAFFRYADLVKFAKGVASKEQCDDHLGLIKEIIYMGEKENKEGSVD
jgi:hypothetical protein